MTVAKDLIPLPKLAEGMVEILLDLRNSREKALWRMLVKRK